MGTFSTPLRLCQNWYYTIKRNKGVRTYSSCIPIFRFSSLFCWFGLVLFLFLFYFLLLGFPFLPSHFPTHLPFSPPIRECRAPGRAHRCPSDAPKLPILRIPLSHRLFGSVWFRRGSPDARPRRLRRRPSGRPPISRFFGRAGMRSCPTSSQWIRLCFRRFCFVPMSRFPGRVEIRLGPRDSDIMRQRFRSSGRSLPSRLFERAGMRGGSTHARATRLRCRYFGSTENPSDSPL